MSRLKHMRIQAVSFDFYMTLICPSNGKGRGQSYQEFLRDHQLESDPWEHQVLYDVFEYFGRSYHPEMSRHQKNEFWMSFTRLLFRRTNVSGYEEQELPRFAGIMKTIFGPEYFELFPEVQTTLHELKSRGLKLAVISNWQRGLANFCRELGILDHLSEVVASAEIGYAKPDPRIFEEAAYRLHLSAQEIIHVGDSLIDDIEGAAGAGFLPVLIDRTSEHCGGTFLKISSLADLLVLPGLRR